MDFSEKYQQFDKQIEENLNFKHALEMELHSNYLPFYEKAIKRLHVQPLTASLIFGAVLFSLHVVASVFDRLYSPSKIIEDFSFFLSIMNALGLYLLFSASYSLREFVANLVLLTKDENKRSADFFLTYYHQKFLGRQTIFFGLLFAIINMGLALLFGIEYLKDSSYWLFATFMFQVATIGFIGGITVNGAIVVVRLINKISVKEDIDLMYFYPDKCAGTLVVGNILFLFSMHFIAIGVLIFLFLHIFEWSNIQCVKNPNPYVFALYVFWKVFPIVLSGIIFFLPVKKLNAILKEYKIFEQLKIRRRIDHLNRLLLSLATDDPSAKSKVETLDNYYERLIKIDKQIDQLSTWPYNLQYRTSFLSVFIPVSIGIILELSKNFISALFE